MFAARENPAGALATRGPPWPSGRFTCTNAGGNWWLFDHRTGLTDELFALISRESPTKWMRTSDVKALLNKSIEPVVEIPRATP